MEIRFKSSECNKGELVKVFKKDFKNSGIEEYEYSEFDEGVVGLVTETHLNNAYVLCQDYSNNNTETSTLEVQQSEPVLLLQFVLEGNVTCCFNEEEVSSFSLSSNSYNLFYIPTSKRLYRYTTKNKHVLNIYFSETFIQNKLGYCFINSFKNYHKAKKESLPFAFFDGGLNMSIQLRAIIDECLQSSFDGIAKQSFMEAKLTELVLLSLIKNKTEENVFELSSDDRENLKKVEHYIHSHLKKELNISELSLMAGLNTSKFKKTFKNVYETTVFKYITSLRIEKAKKLILEENYTIAQASYEVGYKNPQHFTVAFKKKLGYLPSQLKKHIHQILYFAYFNDFDIALLLGNFAEF